MDCNPNSGWVSSGVSVNAISFDGVDDCITVNIEEVKNSNYTISAWAKLNTEGGNNDYIFGSTAVGRYIFWISNNTIGLRHRGSGISQITAPYSFNVNTWYHVAATFNQAYGMELFVNGVSIGTDLDTYANTWDGIVYVACGASNSSGSVDRFFNGSIDEVKIYNRALTSEEILALYNEASQECVDTTTLIDYISQWKQGSLGMLALMEKIGQWKAGTGCS